MEVKDEEVLMNKLKTILKEAYAEDDYTYDKIVDLWGYIFPKEYMLFPHILDNNNDLDRHKQKERTHYLTEIEHLILRLRKYTRYFEEDDLKYYEHLTGKGVIKEINFDFLRGYYLGLNRLLETYEKKTIKI